MFHADMVAPLKFQGTWQLGCQVLFYQSLVYLKMLSGDALLPRLVTSADRWQACPPQIPACFLSQIQCRISIKIPQFPC
jgi:hypothetical protein